MQEALEQAEQEERRRSSKSLGNSRTSAAGMASAKARHGKSRGSSGSGGRGSGGVGGGTVAHNDEKAAEAYSLALARVRRETVQEGLRKKGNK